MSKPRTRAPLSCRRVGCLGSLIFGGLAAGEFMRDSAEELNLFADPTAALLVIIYTAIAWIFALSVRIGLLRPVQPVLLLAAVPVQAFFGSGALGGMGFAIAATVLLVRLGFFRQGGRARILVVTAIVAASELGGWLASERPLVTAGPALACAVASCLLIVTLAQSRVLSSVVAAKETLSLADHRLSPLEQELVRDRLGGKTVKEISYDRHLANSTVRNIFCRVYKKLGLRSVEELFALAERYHIV
ncbi:MAG TPA: LuxR C-terminal-related transcriptional regulator [Rectinemataceae bacterium]|nr:LuxR C-terminal-related transcriptional regulator [Rectinemataceae bacterium]